MDIFFKHNDWRIAFFHGLSALQASLIVQLLHPFDVIKTRLQSHDGSQKNLVPQYSGISNAFKTIYVQEGIKGLYRGVAFTLVAQSLSSFLFFGLYGMRKDLHTKDDSRFNGIMRASAEAGVIATFLTTPLWVLKTRMLLNTSKNLSGWINLKICCQQIYYQHGILGFYRGLSLSILLSSHGIVQIMIYEKLDRLYKLLKIRIELIKIYKRDYLKHNYQNVIKPSINGFTSKILTSLILYPLSVVRTRIQQNQFYLDPDSKYKNIRDVIVKLYNLEGVKGFYKGIVPSLLRSAPSNALFFSFYELFKNNLYKY